MPTVSQKRSQYFSILRVFFRFDINKPVKSVNFSCRQGEEKRFNLFKTFKCPIWTVLWYCLILLQFNCYALSIKRIVMNFEGIRKLNICTYDKNHRVLFCLTLQTLWLKLWQLFIVLFCLSDFTQNFFTINNTWTGPSLGWVNGCNCTHQFWEMLICTHRFWDKSLL